MRERLRGWEAALAAATNDRPETDEQILHTLRQMDRFFDHEMAHHFRAEEDVLYATAKQRLPRLQALVQELHQEHDLIRQALEQFHRKRLHVSSAGGLHDLPHLCRELIAYLRYHLDHEERELLSTVQREFTQDDWWELRRMYVASEVA